MKLILTLGLLLCVGCSTGSGAGDAGAGGTGTGDAGAAGRGGSGGIDVAACSDTPCPDDFYCRGECQAREDEGGDSTPSCSSSPDACPALSDVSRPVCGCDGTVYPDECNANIEGTDRGNDCDDQNLWPDGRFLCWSDFCEFDSEYCERPQGDGNDANIYEDCLDLPQPCIGLTDATALCECVINEKYGGDDSIECVPTQRDGAVGASIVFNLI